MLANTADQASGSSELTALTRRPRRSTAGRQVSRAIGANAASAANSRRRGGAALGVTAATTATPLLSATAWITTADAAAGSARTPACWARTRRPATLHTFPGTYRPRLASVQMRARSEE